MHENDSMKEEIVNGRTASINIPGDIMMSSSSSPKSPKSPSSQAVVEKRNSMRQQDVMSSSGGREKEHREHVNGAKVGNHYNNNSKVNSACLNNLILPLLSEVSLKIRTFLLYLFSFSCLLSS